VGPFHILFADSNQHAPEDIDFCAELSNSIICSQPMTEKEIVLETIRALPDNCSLEEIAERIEFMAAVQKGLD
jgi:hypothetical protein